MVDSTKPEQDAAVEAAKGGGSSWELLYCGGTSFDTMNKMEVSGPQGNLLVPTRLRPLLGIDIRFVATGCTACHCVALDAEGRCYTWGFNEKGQLGHGDTLLRKLPTVVSELSNYKITKASVGRNHTVVVTDDKKSFSFGCNKHGQLGMGHLSNNDVELLPAPCDVKEATDAVCGADFTVWLSSKIGYPILTAGHPQYGQLGHDSENKCNAKDSSAKLTYIPQPNPTQIAKLSEKTIVKVACGANHTVAVDSSGFVYTWGCGQYGRLGHGTNKDQLEPCLVKFFEKHKVLRPDAVVSAGSASSACSAGGHLYMWGRLNTSDNWMEPKPVTDLRGWRIRCMASGNMHHVIGADDSCISWGTALCGELGYGPNWQKSTANPKKIDILAGMHVTSVGCGRGMSLIAVDRAHIGHKLDQLDVYDGDISTKELQIIKEASASARENVEMKETEGRRRRMPSGRGRGHPKKTDSPALEAGSSGCGVKRVKK